MKQTWSSQDFHPGTTTLLCHLTNTSDLKTTDIELQQINKKYNHYGDVIMSTIAFQITSLTIVYSTVYSGADQRKHQNSASLALCGEFTGDRWIPRTNGQLRENVSIWWRHCGIIISRGKVLSSRTYDKCLLPRICHISSNSWHFTQKENGIIKWRIANVLW